MLEIMLIGTELLDDYYGALPSFYHEMFAAFGRTFAATRSRISRIGIVPDDRGAIVGWLHEAHDRGSDLVITVGGLGPTPDDMTKNAICTYLGDELVLDPDARVSVEAFFRQKFGHELTLEGRRRLFALVPSSAEVLPSIHGAAPGFYIPPGRDRVAIIALPGVTYEATGILDDHARAYLPADRPEDETEAVLRFENVPEMELATIFEKLDCDRSALRVGTYLEKDEDGAFSIVRVVLKGAPEEVEAAGAFLREKIGAWQRANPHWRRDFARDERAERAERSERSTVD